MSSKTGLSRLNSIIVECRKCPRLVKHRESVAQNPPKRYQGQHYWGKPLPGFGDPNASIYIVGLAPAANGGNRTGRIFTGDRSGDWLFDALYQAGLANQPQSISRNDGLQMNRTYIGAAVRCAPPGNKPLLSEFHNCRPYLIEEFHVLKNARVVIALGSIAYHSIRQLLKTDSRLAKFRFPAFGHGREVPLNDGRTILCSYHPSQQNTFTKRLTKPMFQSIFTRAVELTTEAQRHGGGQ